MVDVIIRLILSKTSSPEQTHLNLCKNDSLMWLLYRLMLSNFWQLVRFQRVIPCCVERLIVSDRDILRTFFPVSKQIPWVLGWGTSVSFCLGQRTLATFPINLSFLCTMKLTCPLLEKVRRFSTSHFSSDHSFSSLIKLNVFVIVWIFENGAEM